MRRHLEHEEAQALSFHTSYDSSNKHDHYFNPLTPELNPSAQRCPPRFFTGDFNF
jgi:hypothetical protein